MFARAELPARWSAALLLLLFCAAPAAGQIADLIGLPVVEVHVEQEDRPVSERLILGLIATGVGEPLSMNDVRESIEHLYGLGRFDDVQVSAERAGTGVRITYVLVPRHAVQAVEFRGRLGIPEGELRQEMTTRFGSLPSAERANDVARALLALYRSRGYVRARVESQVQELHDPDRAVLTFSIDSGERAPIREVAVEGIERADRLGLEAENELQRGRPYDSAAIERRLERYVADLRARGYYEARASHAVAFTPEGQADVTVTVERGPHVTIAFAGDRLPDDVREDLVPLRREGSVDEDLLEDVERAIEDYLHARGYRDADVHHGREQKGEELVITIGVKRGARHLVERLEIAGNGAIGTPELAKLVNVEPGEPFVQGDVDRGSQAVTQLYRSRGFTRAEVEPTASVLPGANTPTGDRRVLVTLTVAEGPRTTIGSVTLQGNTALSEGQLRSVMQTTPGRAYSEVEVAQDRDRIELEYLNRGYESVVVSRQVTLADNDTRADVRFSIAEGPQVLVDRIIIIGNRRISTETIERAVVLQSGEPLGAEARSESQRRLAALGLFRRISITPLRHGSEPRRDILIEVEEAPSRTVDFGGGFEVVNRLRSTGPGGQAEENLEFAPRGFFGIGQRNLFGKNRSINLFTRVGLKRRSGDITEPTLDTDYGFNEYRVVAAYREPRAFDTTLDAIVTATADQALRSTFNFRSRELRAELGTRFAQHYGIAGRYAFEQNELFDEQLTEEQKPLIDRLFPEVRLSKVSLFIFRDTRDDAIDPNRGTFLSADNDVGARALGSEVGFVKTSLQASTFRRLPGARRVVLRLRGLLGLAQGFEREVEQTGEDGVPVTVTVDDLPASERFFAGGDTTVRGFSLDRLGTAETITPSGFPTGGNGVLVLNGEVLVNAWGALDVVGFLDVGNVYPRVDDVDLTDMRPAAGFGFRYRSPIGPVRVDIGFNLDPRELVPGRRERRIVPHLSFGQAF